MTSSKPRESFQILKTYNPSNLPGKTIIVGLIDIPPNGASPPHRHGGAAIVAVPFQGTQLNQMNGDAPIRNGPGEFFYEAPGCHHERSENAGEGHAKFIAVLIVDDETIDYGTDLGAVFVLDKEVEMGERKASSASGGCH
jgi:quercetin dioxygenase-like cupin family protein